MQLVGYGFLAADGPVKDGYVRLDEVTLVMGANDVGKSRLVRNLRQCLERGRESGHSAIVAELTADEVETLLEHLVGEQILMRAPSHQRDAELRSGLISQAIEAGGAPAWAIEEAYGAAIDRGCAIFEPHADPAGASWHVYLALSLNGSELQRGVTEVVGANGELSAQAARWRDLPDIPVRVIDLGLTRAPLLPRALVVPHDWDALAESASRVLTHLTWHLSWADEHGDRLSRAAAEETDSDTLLAVLTDVIPTYFESAADDNLRSRWLTTTADGGTHFDPGLRLLVRHFRVAVQRELPSFVATNCEFASPLPDLIHWSDQAPLELRLARHGAEASTFPIDDVADGHRIWLQLALAEVVDRMSLVGTNLSARLSRLEEIGAASSPELEQTLEELLDQAERAVEARRLPRDHPAYSSFEQGRLGLEALRDARDAAKGVLAGYLEIVRHLRAEGFTAVAGTADEPPLLLRPTAAPDELEHFDALRPPVYLIDEPERHLHPGVQSAAARWLIDNAREHRSQAVVISHAVPFLNLRDGASFAFIRRGENGASTVTSIRPEHLTALSEEAAELGLNRGQLLAAVQLILFVEGRADQIVLETLSAPRLADMGVAVVPISGAGRHAQIFDSDVLLRFTTARTALMLDNLKFEEIDTLLNDDGALEKALRSRKIEEQAMASVIKNARVHGRRVEPVAHPFDDIFDVLDEDAIRARFPDFPGHEAANAKFRAERQKWGHRKVLYADFYGIPRDISVYAQLADDMRAAGKTSPELEAVLDRIEVSLLGG